MFRLVYPAIFSDNGNNEGFTVSFPDLPGCISFGTDLADAICMAQDAACGWILGELEDGNPVPAQSMPSQLKTEPGEFISMIVLDMDKFAERYGSKVVRKNTTIPAWLSTYADKRGINYSQVLTDALARIYQEQNCYVREDLTKSCDKISKRKRS